MSNSIDKLAEQISLSRINNYDDFVKLRDELTDNDFKIAVSALRNGVYGADDETIKILAKAINFFTKGNLIVNEHRNLQDSVVTGGILPNVSLREALKDLMRNETDFKRAISYALTTSTKFAELYYATYIIEIWPGAVFPNSQNGVDLYIFDFMKKDDGSIVYLDNEKNEIPSDQLKTYVENLIHNKNPSTKHKRDNEIGIAKIIEIKSKKTNGKFNNVADNDFEFGKKQILDIVNGEFSVKNGVAFVFYDEYDVGNFALFVDNTPDAKTYKQIRLVADAEARINAFLWKIQDKEINADILKFREMPTKSSWITSNRNTHTIPLWKLPTDGWYFKGFDDVWVTDGHGISLTTTPYIFAKEFKMSENVLAQKMLLYVYRFVKAKYEKAREALIKIGNVGGSVGFLWKLKDEEALTELVAIFNELMDNWLLAVTTYSQWAFKDDIIYIIDNISQYLHLSGHRLYTAESLKPSSGYTNRLNNAIEEAILNKKEKDVIYEAIDDTRSSSYLTSDGQELKRLLSRGAYTIGASSELSKEWKVMTQIDAETGEPSAVIVEKRVRRRNVLK